MKTEKPPEGQPQVATSAVVCDERPKWSNSQIICLLIATWAGRQIYCPTCDAEIEARGTILQTVWWCDACKTGGMTGSHTEELSL